MGEGTAGVSNVKAYLSSYSFWEAHQGFCGLACVSLRLRLAVVLSVAFDSQRLQRQCKNTVRERMDSEISCQRVFLKYTILKKKLLLCIERKMAVVPLDFCSLS